MNGWHADTPSDPRRGAALILCIAFTAAAVSLVVVLSTRAVAHARQAESAAFISAAFSAAELAQARAIADMNRGGSGTTGYGGTHAWGEPLPRFGDPGVYPEVDEGPPAVAWFAVGIHPAGLPEDLRVVYAFARCGNVERCIETVLRRGGTHSWTVVTWRELRPGGGEG